MQENDLRAANVSVPDDEGDEAVVATRMCVFGDLAGEGVLGRMMRGRGGVLSWMVRGLLARRVMCGIASGLGGKSADLAEKLSMSVPGPEAGKTQGVLRRLERSRLAGEEDIVIVHPVHGFLSQKQSSRASPLPLQVE